MIQLQKLDERSKEKQCEIPPSKAKVQQSTKNIMALISWNWKTLQRHLKEKDTTSNGEYYVSLLHKQIKILQ